MKKEMATTMSSSTENVSTDSVLSALDAIEDLEARFLAWALIDESLTREQLVEIVKDACPGVDVTSVIRRLQEERLIGEVPYSTPPRYRTRMAETVRLLAQLRQLFPRKHWRAAPSLVADYRFRHEPRSFPKRDHSPQDAIALFRSCSGIGLSQLEQIEKVIADRHLSTFQIDATMRVFEAVNSRADRGVVVGAGTGSGKTLAFYLPALSLVADRSTHSSGTQVIAIYPRNELLKDQLASALEETQNLRSAGGPQIRVGAYFGPTPGSAKRLHYQSAWIRSADGHVCPYLTCRNRTSLNTPCDGELVWKHEHQSSGVEQLTCRRCQWIVSDSEFAFTRNSMQKRPPEILFTTTEMLNRSLSDGWSMHVFGVGPRAKQPPKLILLDEAHTYSGVSGAQVAYLLRRWRRAIANPVAMVGLSATLANPATFFSELSGIKADFVSEVTPHVDDLVQRGRSYQILLRGDPASQTALLSTSIQSLMLLRRMLDQPNIQNELRAYGSRVFAFCDNLDIANRLYRQLLDAEGRTPFNKPDPTGFTLATLRLAEMAQLRGESVDWRAREPMGQYWWMAESIGCGTESLSIGRTTSQDSGVLKNAEVVVATASLDVGYDDPEVGAVLQHKAPRDEAQFLQRIGRAGRTQTQRPWTAVVLSDFGRDRAAYIDYEQILNPVVPPKSLPLGNQSLRKMQATFCLMDWASYRLNAAGNQMFSMRKYFAEPTEDQMTEKLASLIAAVLGMGKDYHDLCTYLGQAMHLTESEIESLMWEQPRPMMLETLPTLHRRLKTAWGTKSQQGYRRDKFVKDHPLPEFAPRSLFDDLLLPEVRIEPPEDYNKEAKTTMPIIQAMTELAPGRVSLRWAVKNIRGLWNFVELVDKGTIEIENGFAAEYELIDHIEIDSTKSSETIPLIRPTVMRPFKTDSEISSKSNGQLRWEMSIDRAESAIDLMPKGFGRLDSVINSCAAYLHVGSGPLRMRRYTRGVDTTVTVSRQKINGSHYFTQDGNPVAIGFDALVDGVIFEVAPPSLPVKTIVGDQPRLRQLRRDLFTDRCSEEWSEINVDDFLGARLVEIAIAVAAVSSAEGNASPSLISRDSTWWTESVTDVIDELLLLDDNDDTDSPLRDAVLEAFQRQEVLDLILKHLPALYSDPDNSWDDWLRDRIVSSLAGAIHVASQSVCNNFDLDSEVIVDFQRSNDVVNIIISDTTIGGGGAVEALVRHIAEDPKRFEHLLVSALEPSDLEQVDHSLSQALQLLSTDPDVQATSNAFRNGKNEDRLRNWARLRALFSESGIDPNHATSSALATRIFRSGSSEVSDEVLRIALDELAAAEEKAGFSFGQQLASVMLGRSELVKDQLEQFLNPDLTDQLWAQLIMRSLLWPRAEERRSNALQVNNRFVKKMPKTERTLVIDALGTALDNATVDVSEGEWRASLTDLLRRFTRATLVTSGSPTAIRSAIVDLTTNPLDLGWTFAHPRLERIRRSKGSSEVLLVLDEAPQ